MILRFLPDTWVDAVLRPVAMAMPDAFVYVELHAPDLRFVAALIVTLVLLLCLRVRRMRAQRPVFVLSLVVWLGFVPWLATSGNGRYFIPMLLMVGVLCVALIHHLPSTRSMRLTLAVTLLGLQLYAVDSVNQWDRWGFVNWAKAPYFDVEKVPGVTDTPHTFVTITQVGYSLIAPQFHRDSRWVGSFYLPDRSTQHPDFLRAQHALKQSTSLRLIVNTLPKGRTAAGQPNAATRSQMDAGLEAHNLQLIAGTPCTILRSRSMALLAYAEGDLTPEVLDETGFWVCPIQQVDNLVTKYSYKVNDPEVIELFSHVEQRCPRFFPPGQATVVRTADGYKRSYPQSDMWVMVINGVGVMYKYWHALNPVLIGTEEQVRRGDFLFDCKHIRGRSGLPWEREI